MIQSFMISVEYRHLDINSFSDFLISAKDLWDDMPTRESVSINFGNEGDFETGAKRVEIRKEDGEPIKDYEKGIDKYVIHCAKEPGEHIFIIKRIENYSIELFEGFEFKEFDADSTVVNFNEGGSINSLEFGDSNYNSMVSDTDEEVLFEDLSEYEDTEFECFIIENGKPVKLDFEVIMEDLVYDGKEGTEILNNISNYYY